MIHNVGIAQMKISGVREDVLVTHALGSCLGIAIYDYKTGVGALSHLMLPAAAADPDKARQNPLVYVDSGVRAMVDGCLQAGAAKPRLVVKAAGGASAHGDGEDDLFQIGKRNYIMLRRVLWEMGMMLKSHDVGGNCSRMMSLHIATGEVQLKISGQTIIL